MLFPLGSCYSAPHGWDKAEHQSNTTILVVEPTKLNQSDFIHI